MKHYLLIALTLLLASFAQGQFYTGMEGSAYAGVSAVTFNPAIANSPFVADINLVGISAGFDNNYIGVDRHFLLKPSIGNQSKDFQKDFLHERLNGNGKNVYLGMQLAGPLSFMFSFGSKKKPNKNAIAFSYHTNFVFNADNINETLARSAYYGMGSTADNTTHFVGKGLSNSNLGVRVLVWNDFGISYSRVVYEKNETSIKVGGTLKLLQPLVGGYVYADNINYKFNEINNLSITRTNINYAYSEGMLTSKGYSAKGLSKSYTSDMLSYKHASPTVAVDMGVIYEVRPTKDSRDEQMNCGGSWSGYQPKPYKLAIGVSIIDLGAVKMKRGEYSGNFNASVQNWDVGHVNFPNGVQSVDDTIHTRFRLLQDNKGSFTMWLPTRFNLFVDYNIWRGLGVMGSAIISPNMSSHGNMVHQVTTFTGTLKYENKWVGIYIPVSCDIYGNAGLGMTLRAGPLVIGTQDLLCLFAKKYVYNAEVHAAVKITIPYFKTYHKYDVRFAKKSKF